MKRFLHLPARVPATFAAAALAALAGGCRTAAPAGAAAAADWDWGPVASRLTDVHGHTRLRAAGPVFERTRDPATGHRFFAARPFYAEVSDPATGRSYRDVLWPLAAGKTLNKQMSWRVALTWYQDFDTDDPHSRWRLWALPFYFQGRDAQGRPYLAVFPVGGRIREFFMLDRVDFALFPLWVKSAQNEVRSTTLLWPIFSATQGKGIHRFRVFPIYGRSAQRDAYVKKFVLWPFFTSARYNYPQSSGYGFILLPLYGRIRLTDQDSHLVLPPLFRYTRGARQSLVNAPWPFMQIGWGETRRLYVWPLYGRLRRPGVATDFVLWPLGWRERVDRPGAIFRSWKALPFVQYERTTVRRPTPGQAPVTQRYLRLWPLFSYERRGTESRLRALELLPFRNPPPVERNWAPFWTLFETTAVGGARDTELLWGLYRRQSRGERGVRTSIFPLVEWSSLRADAAAPSQRSWSLLKGLLGIESEGAHRRLRVLYFLRFSLDGDPTP